MDNIEKLKEEIQNTESDDVKESNIAIVDVLYAAAAFLDDSQNEDKVKAFDDIKQKTIVRSYMPLRRKAAIVNKILKDISEANADIYDFGSAFEIAMTFDGLLAYTNTDQNINTLFKDYDLYDVLWASGYCDMILEYCAKDYQGLRDMVDRLVSYQNIGELMDALNNIDYDSIADLNQTIDRFNLNVKPEVIHDLATIVANQDEAVQSLNEVINEAAMQITKTKEGETENK